MKISPEPDWKKKGASAAGFRQSTRGTLKQITTYIKKNNPPILQIRDKYSNPLGSFTPEWFLKLDRREQLSFLSVAKRMHDRGVDR